MNEASSKPVVRLADAAVRLGGRTIWSDANVEINEGSFVVVLGPNGAGKTTLLRLILGLESLERGIAEVFGQHPHRGNRRVGYVPQRQTLQPELAVRGTDLVGLGVDGHRWGIPLFRETQKKKRALVEAAINAVEAGSYAGRQVGRLSGGEQQRLILAQALISRPRLLLLDEPLSNLDLRNQAAAVQFVARLAHDEGITVVLVAHDVNPLLPHLDQVVYIAKGKFATGKPDEIITTERLSDLYEAPVEIVEDSRGRIFVVGLEEESAHPHK
ncbi:MAG: ABC transporter ATP-binding protein [Actinobacteria bacterium]|nr:ABC transporter ATP-binding protein [Actinomycetota bacterium]